MQRENNILIKHKNNRAGFAMMMAIMVIVIIATLMAASLSMTSETSKRTTDVYMHEQALLLTRSATEYALLKLSGENRAAGGACLNNIQMAYPTNAAATKLFDININISYYGLETVCNNSLNPAPNNIITPESAGTILLDVMVSSNQNLPIEPIRYHRRTLQKL